MKLIDKYIFKQVLFATLFGVILFLIVWISPEILFRIIKQTIYGEISGSIAIQLFFLQIPEILGKAIPVGLLLGSLFVFDRLSKDSELIILRGIGVSFTRLILPILALSIIGMIACFSIYDTLIPYSTLKIKELKHSIDQNHFVYVDKTSTGKPKQILIVTNYDGVSMHNIKLLLFSNHVNAQDPLMSNIITAKYATYNHEHWFLYDGINYEIEPNGVYKDVKHFKKMQIFSKESSNTAYKLLIYSTKKASEMNVRELIYHVKLLKSENLLDEYRFMLNKFYQRFSQSFSCILLAICGVILGFGKPREKRFIGYTMGAGIIFLYYMIVPFLDMLAQTGILLPVIAAWMPCILISIAIISLVKHKHI